MANVLRASKNRIPPVGKESCAEMLGSFCVRKTPAGGDYSRIRSFSDQMRNHPTSAENQLFKILESNNFIYQSQKIILPYIADCLIPSKKLIIELDGRHHTESIKQFTYDTNRDSLLMSLGITVVRIDNENLNSKFIINLLNNIQDFKHKPVIKLIREHNRSYSESGFTNINTEEFKKSFYHFFNKEMEMIMFNSFRIYPKSRRKFKRLKYLLSINKQ